MPRPAPTVSVLVPLRGEPVDVVLATLDSLRRVDHPAYEVIVIGSRDDAAVAAYCVSTGLRFVEARGAGPATLADGMAAVDARSAVTMVVDAAEPVGRDLLAALRDVAAGAAPLTVP